jgi:polysaccharide deacetylase family protein (PEP-CTERM system associated)
MGGRPASALPGFEVRALEGGACKLFSVDVEEWFHSNFVSAPALDTSRLPRRASVGVSAILDVLAEARSRATFFVLGEVAKEQPELVRRIADAGHEIACHSLAHSLVYEQRRDDFARDLAEVKRRLEDLSGQPVWGFRAPSWSITAASLWALDTIAEAGFRYDSSIFPAKNYLYGVDGAPLVPCLLRTPAGNTLLEVPPSTLSIGPLRFGVGGGFYLRVLPLWVHEQALARAVRQGVPFLAYVHPREFDPGSWALELPLSRKEKLIHSGALRLGASRARALLGKGGWEPIGRLVDGAPQGVHVPFTQL